jgi:hypothetical protein
VDAVVDPFALSLPSHVPFHTAKGYTLSLARQVLSGRMDSVIKTVEHNIRLVLAPDRYLQFQEDRRARQNRLVV